MLQKFIRLILLFFFVLALYSPLFSQGNEKQVNRHFVFWHKTEIHEFIKGKWGVGFDFVLRTKNAEGKGHLFQYRNRESYRPWISYQFTPNARLSLSPVGYMRTDDYVARPEDYLRPITHELRTTLQFFHHYKMLKGRIMHTWRYRYELRWQQREGSEDVRFLQRIRFRYRIRVMLNKNNFYENGVWYAMVSDEFAFNFGKSVPYMFNQNRLYAGVGVRFLNSVRMELRYVNQYRTRASVGLEYDNPHGVMIGLYIDQLSGIRKKGSQPVRFYD